MGGSIFQQEVNLIPMHFFMSVVLLLNTHEFYTLYAVWNLIDFCVFIVFLSEMGLAWLSEGLFAPKESAYFWNPVNVLEFIVNCMMVLSIFITDEQVTSILKRFRIIRIAKLPGIITSFSSDRSLSTFLESISKSYISLSSVVIAGLFFIFFFGIIGVQVSVDPPEFFSILIESCEVT